MDRLYNNEAIVGSVILLLLNSGDMEMARLSNSLVMLSQADLLLVTKDKISLTDNGKEVIKEIRKNNSKRLKRILKVYNLILNRVNQVSTEQLYKSLNIKL